MATTTSDTGIRGGPASIVVAVGRLERRALDVDLAEAGPTRIGELP